MEELLSKISNASLTKEHHYDRDTYCWRKWDVSFDIGKDSFEFYDGADADRYYNDDSELSKPCTFKKLHEKWNLSALSAKELKALFKHILKVDEDAYRFQDNYD